MHVGVFGEFVLSYMGLALFAVLVATSSETTGLWAFVVFAAPLAFARQMFQRTHSLQEATNELAEKQAENEYQALHDSLTGLPNRLLFQLRLADAIERRAARRRQLARDADRPRPLQGDQRHARPPLRRPAAEGDRPAPVDACCATTT